MLVFSTLLSKHTDNQNKLGTLAGFDEVYSAPDVTRPAFC